MTIDELEDYCRKNGTWQDIFTTTDLRLPSNVRVLRDREQIKRWMKYTEPEK